MRVSASEERIQVGGGGRHEPVGKAQIVRTVAVETVKERIIGRKAAAERFNY